MKSDKNSYAALGMLAGIVISGGLGVVLFATTGQIMYLTFAGAGAALGILIGSGFDLKGSNYR